MFLTEDYNAQIKARITHYCNGPGLFVVKLLQVYDYPAYYGPMRQHMNHFYSDHQRNQITPLTEEKIKVGVFCVVKNGLLLPVRSLPALTGLTL